MCKQFLRNPLCIVVLGSNDDIILQADNWIDEKLKTATSDSFSDVSDLYDKMRRLQKHQAFEAEIMANVDRIRDVKEVSCPIVQ